MSTNLEERTRELAGEWLVQHKLPIFDKTVDSLAALLTHVQAEARLAALEEAAQLIERAFEQSWVVQDTLDAIRARAQAAAPATLPECPSQVCSAIGPHKHGEVRYTRTVSKNVAAAPAKETKNNES